MQTVRTIAHHLVDAAHVLERIFSSKKAAEHVLRLRPAHPPGKEFSARSSARFSGA
jgi:hypothetical protein